MKVKTDVWIKLRIQVTLHQEWAETAYLADTSENVIATSERAKQTNF